MGPRPASFSGNENKETNWKTDLTYRFDVMGSTQRVLVGYEYYRGSYRNYRTIGNPNWVGNNADGVAGNVSGSYAQDIFGRRWTGPAAANNAFAPGADVSRDGGDSFYGPYLGQYFGTRLTTLVGVRKADLFTTDFNSTTENHVKKTVPQAGVLFKINQDLGVYASYSESFRLNNDRFTLNAPAASNPGAYVPLQAFPPQEGKGIDVGIKFQLLDKKLSGNLTAFDTDYTEIPITSATILDDKGNFVRFPGDAQNSKGQEFELFYTVNPELQITAGVTHTNATYTTVTRGQEYLLGQRLSTTAEWQGSFFAQYTAREGRWKGFSIGAGGYHLGKGAQGDFPRFPPASYTVFDAVLGYASRIGGVDVHWTLNVNNLANRAYYQDFTAPYPPRTARLGARLKF